jgi:hypothetical protein
MTKVCKKPAIWNFPRPKRGKARMVNNQKVNLKKVKKNTNYGKTPYVRHGELTTKSRPERQRFVRTLKDIWSATNKQLIDMLHKDGVLPEFAGTTCPSCCIGKLGVLKFYPVRGWIYRCNKFGCQHFLLAHAGHPIFSIGSGSRSTPLQDQAAVLVCAVAGTTQAVCHKLTGLDHKTIEGVYTKLDHVRLVSVEHLEKKIRYGEGVPWNDIEADEVDVRKFEDPEEPDAKQAMSWEQWGGVVERGHPRTLILTRLDPKKSVKRCPGPGPIRKVEWKKFAEKHLKNRKVILHTDGAKAYKLKVDGVLHDNVVHQKKQVLVRGNIVWLKPKFVKVHTHTLPNRGGQLMVKAGTQIIDRFWAHLRRHVNPNSSRVNSFALRRRIRSAQWTYWYKGVDQWLQTGTMLTEVRLKGLL